MDPPKPDGEEKVIRFGCGSFMGATLAFIAGLQVAVGDTSTWIILVVVAALVCGALALMFGDRFWHRLLGLFRWWQ